MKTMGCHFYELSNKSHDAAWQKTWLNSKGKRGAIIDIIDIAEAAGADYRTIDYIREELELQAALR